jgi:Trk K+ transport system NAD-binding subunit
MGARRRFVLAGLSRVGIRVAELLAGTEPDSEVVVVASPAEMDLAHLAPTSTRMVMATAGRETALREAGLPDATALLALSDDDLENLNTAVAANVLAPNVPVVLRAFDPALADQLGGLNVRRAYSTSALAAPAFVAAALADEVLVTLRIGDHDVVILNLLVGVSSPIAGLSVPRAEREFGCAVVARSLDGQRAARAGTYEPLTEGERILVGGPLRSALRLAVGNHAGEAPSPHGERRRRRSRPGQRTASEHAGSYGATLLPATAAVLGAFLVLTVVTFALALHLNPVDATYFAVSTALGNSTLDQSDAWLKVVGLISMVLGGALLGVMFSYLASVATTQRLEQRMGRRAREMSGHAVVVGLGTVGYRVEGLLHELGIPTAVLDRAPDPRFAGAVGERTPVLTGDVRLSENLDRAGIRAARWLVACTADDLTNIEACLSARRLNPGIRTVARIFEADLAERVGGSFGIDRAVSASRAAASAFAGAATDERAIRTFEVAGQRYASLRYQPRRPVPLAEIERWPEQGIRVLAVRFGAGPVRPTGEVGDLGPGDSAVLTGPFEAVQALFLPD